MSCGKHVLQNFAKPATARVESSFRLCVRLDGARIIFDTETVYLRKN